MDTIGVIKQGGFIDISEKTQTNSEDQRYAEVGQPCGDLLSFADLLYSFLSDCTHKELRIINKCWNMKVGGNKNVLVARAMVKATILSQSGSSLETICRQNKGCENFDAFKERHERTPELIFKAPSLDSLFQNLPTLEQKNMRNAWRRKRNKEGSLRELNDSELRNGEQGSHMIPANEDQGSHKNPFSLNEFARLMLILRDDEVARAAVMQATEDLLQRRHLDEGVSRGYFWTIIEDRFNNAIVTGGEEFKGRLDDVDPTAKPLEFRRASKLKDAFIDGRAAFTAPKHHWQKSGQNDPERFPNFLRYLENGELSTGGKRAFIIFCTARLGTPHQDDTFMRLVSKTIDISGEDNNGYDEFHAGEKADERNETVGWKRNTTYSPSQNALQVKRRCVDRKNEEDDVFSWACQKMGKLADAKTRKIEEASRPGMSGEKSASILRSIQNGDESRRTLDVVQLAEQEDKMICLIENAAKKMEQAKETGNEKFIAAAQKHFDTMVDRWVLLSSDSLS